MTYRFRVHGEERGEEENCRIRRERVEKGEGKGRKGKGIRRER